jgi:hypothetical protein
MMWMGALSLAGAGTWRLEEQLVAEAKPALPVGWADTQASASWIVQWIPGEPTWTAQLCSMQLSPVLGVEMDWSDQLLDAVPPLTRPVTFDGVLFRSGPVLETLGGGDDDGDGKPGITVQVRHPRAGRGEVYVRQTAWLSWSGTRTDDGQIEGIITYRPRQELLGASTWWLRIGIRQREHAQRSSRFTMSPVPDGTGCDR